MNKYSKTAIIFLITFMLLTLSTMAVRFVSGSDDTPVTTKFAKMLMMQKDYINKSEEVPQDLKDKIALETEYNKTLKVESEKRKQEIEELKNGFDPRSPELIMITMNPEDSKVATVFGEEAYTSVKYTSQADTAYNLLLAGADAKDLSIGVIINKQYSKDSFNVTYDRLSFPDVGAITFESFTNGNKIVVFNYGNGKKGYYNTENNKAIFEPYK